MSDGEIRGDRKKKGEAGKKAISTENLTKTRSGITFDRDPPREPRGKYNQSKEIDVDITRRSTLTPENLE